MAQKKKKGNRREREREKEKVDLCDRKERGKTIQISKDASIECNVKCPLLVIVKLIKKRRGEYYIIFY